MKATFFCRYTGVNEFALCHGLTVTEAELAREVVGAGGLTAGLADTLIDRVYVYPNNQEEIVWKMKIFAWRRRDRTEKGLNLLPCRSQRVGQCGDIGDAAAQSEKLRKGAWF